MTNGAGTVLRPLVVGISGVSSSGKTTLARLLRGIWPNAWMLHEDDFYWTDAKIPVKNGVQDWDCLEAIDLVKFREALLHVREHGAPPPDLESKEDKNVVAESGVSEDELEPYRRQSRELGGDGASTPIVFIDGFLLYSQRMKMIWELLDVRLFLTADFQTVKRRREARSGYVTLEGFWADPPGYIEDVVWPNYVKEHAYLFQDGNVEGSIDEGRAAELDIRTVPKDSGDDVKSLLAWANDKIFTAVQKNLQVP